MLSNFCRICGNQDRNRSHKAKEMMFGTREVFEYLECGSCGTLQIVEIPDLAQHYPRGYFSFDRSAEVVLAKRLRRRLAAYFIGRHLINGSDSIGRYLAAKRAWIKDTYPKSMLEPALDLTFDSNILDFGCGSGQMLRTLYYTSDLKALLVPMHLSSPIYITQRE